VVTPVPLRVVFFGTPQFAVPTLNRLIASSHSVVAVVTQPDRPRGRGQHVIESPVKEAAIARGIPVLQPDKLRDAAFVQKMNELEADLGVVAAYGKIIPDPVITSARLGMINVHASLLPRYRGAAPVHRAVVAGETETGVTIMRLVRELDAGPMLARQVRPIGPDETSEALERDLAEIGATLLVTVVDELSAGRAAEVEQDHSGATFAPRLGKEEGLIDWGLPAAAIHNRVRGLLPWPRAYTYLEGARYIVLETRFDAPANAGAPSAEPGEITEASGDRLCVAAGDGGTVRILRLQPEGGRAMTARAFLAGRPLRSGSRFTSPEAPVDAG
jgi:methionyl-tRNA formyltransferase